ncbi:hypothetical protein [Desulfotomaculum sp. 1211_IL3151]|uniref:hypothetical protein n=1 Tax=Desulfotomaculum sp. 1211_IL3151 TaxID=3084055 RepID=UPI002FDA443E
MKIKRLLSVVLLWCLVLLAGCSDNPKQGEETWVLERENAITFSDGESANLWRRDYIDDALYKLSDGTILLTIRVSIGPDNVYVGGVESFDDLSESAQKAVSGFYEGQGLLYDTLAELQNAYEEYLTCKESGKVYQERFISQDIAPTASNDNIMCFLTSVTLPVNGQMAQEIRLGAAFDRKTGEVLSNWDMFTLPEEKTRQWLLDKFVVAAPALRAEMEAALKPEYIILFPQNMEVSFPQGTLPSQEYSYRVSLDYNDLREVLQAWAIPNQVKR